MSPPPTRSLGPRAVLVSLGLCAWPVTSGAGPLPQLELYTMDAGDDVFSRFGHSALCVRDRRDPRGRCYNYGTTDFSTPVPLTWDVLRGRARFWVSVVDADAMVAHYGARGERRTVYRQTLPLSAEAAERLIARLDHDALPQYRYYQYNHFLDNCTTRLRDHLDAVTDGALSRATGAPYGPTWRALVERGFAGETGLLAASELLLGRRVDARPSRWEALFLPMALRDHVTARLAAPPEVVYRRPTPVAGGSPGAGRAVLLALSALVAALSALGCASGRPSLRRAVRVAVGLSLGAVGAFLAALALVTGLPELRFNELLLIFLPTDFALVALTGRALSGYLVARGVWLALVLFLSVLGLLVQPLAVPVTLLAAALGPLAWGERYRGTQPPRVQA